MNPILEFIFNLIVNGIIAFLIFFLLLGSLLGSSIGVNQFKESNIILKIIVFFVYGIFNWLTVGFYFIVLCKIFGKCIPLETPFPF